MTHHEKRSHQNRGDYDDQFDDPFTKLDEIMQADAYRMKLLTHSMLPLTIGRLARIDPSFADRAEAVAESETLWPDETSAASRPPFLEQMHPLVGEEADLSFIIPILNAEDEVAADEQDDDWTKGYNNFPIILKASQRRASPEATREYFEAGDMLGLTYGTKPYLERAYAVAPDFMEALQQATEQLGGMEEWKQAMKEGYISYDSDTDKSAIALRASRMAYVLLTRLMRRDDLAIQKRLLGFPGAQAPLIDSPANELAT